MIFGDRCVIEQSVNPISAVDIRRRSGLSEVICRAPHIHDKLLISNLAGQKLVASIDQFQT